MGIIAWVLVGAIVGGLANYIVKGGFGLIGSVVGGIIGAVIAGYVTNLVFNSADAFGLNIWSIVMSVFFAILVVGFGKVILGRGSEA